MPPAKPEVEIVAVESGPLTAPEPQPVGTFGRITAIAGAWTNKAIDLTGLRVIPALIRSIPECADLIGGELGAAAGGGLVSASR